MIRFFLVALLLSGLHLSAQNRVKLGDKHFNAHDYYKALDDYLSGIANVQSPAEQARVTFQLAECYRKLNRLQEAEAHYLKALEMRHPDPAIFFQLAELQKTFGKYDEAIAYYTRFKEAKPESDIHSYVESCTLAKQWVSNPQPYEIACLTFNTADSDIAPAFADADNNVLYFSTFFSDPSVADGYQTDLFRVERTPEGEWKSGSRLPAPLNTSANEGSATLTKDRKTLYFTRCGREPGQKLHCKLYVAHKNGEQWSGVQVLPFCSDDFQYRQPAVSAGGDTLYFSSNMNGTLGKYDIWMSVLNSATNEYAAPVNLGPSVNTENNEGFPYISEQGSALYFSSDGRPGMGGLDLFRCLRKNGGWTPATNLGYPMNSAWDDFGILFDGLKNRGFFTSNRGACKGDDDIYSFELK